jgi:hypothetical protein
MAQIIPLQAVPNQTLAVALANQSVQLNVYQKTSGLFMDVLVSGGPSIRGVLCLDRNRIVQDLYFGVIGDFAFFDTQGRQDPDYTGFASRYKLVYFEAANSWV